MEEGAGLSMTSSARRRRFGRRYLVYTAVTGLSIAAFAGLNVLIRDPLLALGIPHIVIYLADVLLLGLLFLLLRTWMSGFLRQTLMRRQIESRNRLRDLSEKLSQSTNVDEAAETTLATLQELFRLEDAQLTLYYDQPFALEVTHLRRKQGKLVRQVERVREDEPSIDLETTEMLTPVSAAVTEVLTHRDRLVGLLLLGACADGSSLTPAEAELLSDLVPIIASGIDQISMIRHLSETNQRLFENEKLISIGQLASGIAHEIRNPLTSIKMNLQGLRKKLKLNERDERRVQISLDEIDRLDSIVTELMSFARRTKLVVAPTRAADLIEESLDLARSDLEAYGINVVVEIAPDVPDIRADENRLIRALLNLIINAVQVMEEGGTLTLSAEPYGAGLEIQVADQGPGIPEELRREIFNPFFTTKAQGTGLGLANALKFVQEHGGELDYTTELGVGTTFSLRLPPAPPSYQDDPSALKVVPT